MTNRKNFEAMLVEYPAIEEIEDDGIDDGRFFVHLKDGYDWALDPYQVTRSKSFASIREARKALKNIETVT